MVITNPKNGTTAQVYAFDDSGSTMSLLRRSVADRLGLTITKYIQKCKESLTSKDLQMESASICVRGLAEQDDLLICDVGFLRDISHISQSLSHILNEDIVAEFTPYGTPYPILSDRNSCDLSLRTDYQDFIAWLPRTGSFIKLGNLQANHTPVGWAISGWQDSSKCELNKEQEMHSYALTDDSDTETDEICPPVIEWANILSEPDYHEIGMTAKFNPRVMSVVPKKW